MFFSATQNQYQLGNIAVDLKPHNRAKKIILKVLNGKVVLVFPKRAGVRRAIKFLHSKQDWIEEKIKNRPQKIALEIGAVLPVMGQEHNVIYGGRRGKSEIVGGEIIIRGDELLAPKKIKKVLSEYLKAEITKIANHKSSIINQKFSKISVRETTSRWGSCAHSGNLSFSWRLVFASPEIVEYLVSHEVAHLAEMNHSKRFWVLVESLCPEYMKAKSWLSRNGAKLHLYG